MLATRIHFTAALLGAALIACFAFAASASADVTVTPTVSTTNAKLGAHGDVTFSATYANGVSTTETLKRAIYDLPAGMTYNPAAVATADICPQSTFDTGTCGAASQVGSVTVSAAAVLGIFSTTITDLPGTISVISNSGGITKLGLLFSSGGFTLRATEQLSIASGNVVRLTTDDLPKQLSASGQTATFQITKLVQTLFGKVGGASFLTNPTTGSSWDAFAYSQAYDSNSNADSDPLSEGGGNHFVKSSALTIAADTVPSAPSIDSGPSGTASSGGGSFAFSSDESGVSFETKLDGAAFAAATSPASFSGLADGSHSFEVRAKNSIGTTSSVTTRNWTVQIPVTPPPAQTPAAIDHSVSMSDVKKCLKKPSLQVSPTVPSASHVVSTTILVNKKQVKKLTGSTVSAKVSLPKSLKLKKGKSYGFEVQVLFTPDSASPTGLLVKKSAKFKLCK